MRRTPAPWRSAWRAAHALTSKVSISGMSGLARQAPRMPAEWEPHAGTWIGWPDNLFNWRQQARPAQLAFGAVAEAIAKYEPVTVCTTAASWLSARTQLPQHIRVVELSANDYWLRDTGPTVGAGAYPGLRAALTPPPPDATPAGVGPAAAAAVGAAGQGPEGAGVIACCWAFNAYGQKYSDVGGLDAMIGVRVANVAGLPAVQPSLVLEGGSIHVDGEGTLLTTEECLLHPNRNPNCSKEDIEAQLKRWLGVSKVLWLPRGLYADHDTNGHVDNFACFARPGVVLLAWTDDSSDPQHEISRQALEILQGMTDAAGRTLQVVKLPLPPPLFRTKEECEGLVGGYTMLEEDPMGSDMYRRPGQRLAASYVNFFIANGAVVMPAFGVPEDEVAKAVLQEQFPGRVVIAVPSREVLLGGGNIHCITCQQPGGVQVGAA
ncbi:hypothetical protein QJQ45_016311 [Haematococcus lacustris]|nr:hypothetical protein QJQ45_016311 [Haematococcus lacustris]